MNIQWKLIQNFCKFQRPTIVQHLLFGSTQRVRCCCCCFNSSCVHSELAVSRLAQRRPIGRALEDLGWSTSSDLLLMVLLSAISKLLHNQMRPAASEKYCSTSGPAECKLQQVGGLSSALTQDEDLMPVLRPASQVASSWAS